MRSPCDIQTRWLPGSSNGLGSSTSTWAGPYSLLARGGYLPAQCVSQRLHAITDPQNRQAGFQDISRDLGRLRLVNRGWSARQDKTLRLQGQDPLRRRIPGEKLAVDVQLAHPPGNQLRILGAEVQDGNSIHPNCLPGHHQRGSDCPPSNGCAPGSPQAPPTKKASGDLLQTSFR